MGKMIIRDLQFEDINGGREIDELTQKIYCGKNGILLASRKRVN